MLSGVLPFQGEYMEDVIKKIEEAKVTFEEES